MQKRAAENMGYPGVELTWKPGTDNNWISYYEVFRDGVAIDKVAKGTYYFDHSAGADLAAQYEVRTVDGAGNASPPAAAAGPGGQARPRSFDDAPDAGDHATPALAASDRPASRPMPATLSSSEPEGRGRRG